MARYIASRRRAYLFRHDVPGVCSALYRGIMLDVRIFLGCVNFGLCNFSVWELDLQALGNDSGPVYLWIVN
jgi:hypothetical protein